MYFIEILSKIFKKNKNPKLNFGQNPYPDEVSEEEKCEHMFVPIDSTGKVFACINCGLVLNKKPKNINFFEKDR